MSGANLDRAVDRVIGDRYQLNLLIGSGASAEVYQATDLRLGRSVAVKQLRSNLIEDERFAKLFRSEAHLAAQLSHPNILTVLDWNADPDGVDGGAYIVSEMLGGGTLRSVLDAEGTISVSQAGFIGLQAARGLAAAHESGLVHRDIKPANLLFGRDGRVHIGDFGIARAVAQAAWTEPEGVLIGTARYAAPEQAKTGSIDGLVDVYSLAVCLIEALTGEVPLVQETAIGTMVIRQSEDLPIDDVLGVLSEPLAWAGLADPTYRATAAEFSDALLAVCRNLPDPDPLILLDLTEHTGGPVAVHSLTDQGRGRSDANVHISEDGSLIIEGEDSDIAFPAPGTEDDDIDEYGTDSYEDSYIPESYISDDGDLPDDYLAEGHVPDDYLPHEYGGSEAFEGHPDSELHETAIGFEREGDDVQLRSRPWRRVVLALLFLALLAGAGIGGRMLAQSQQVETEVIALGLPSYPVADFAGLSPAEVEAAALENSWTVSVTEEYADGTEPGQLLSQSPEPGASMGPGGAVALVVSLGPVPRQVPEMVGLMIGEARAAITRAELVVGAIAEQSNETVETGVVLEATIDGVPAQPGAEFLTGTTIDLLVSSGPAPREVPPVVGLTVEAARVVIEDQGLILATAETYSESVGEGLIISMDPPAAASVSRGSTITVTVSLGRPFVEVPDVQGLLVPEALELLQSQGFAVEINGTVGSSVIATRPTAGESVRSGSSIEIISAN
jgi:serine/threonine-protein kinase